MERPFEREEICNVASFDIRFNFPFIAEKNRKETKEKYGEGHFQH